MNNSSNRPSVTQYEDFTKKILIKDSIFSVKNIAKTLKPTIKKIIDSLQNREKRLNRMRMNSSLRNSNGSILKEKYINDLISEFEEDRSRSGSRRSSRAIVKRQTLNIQNPLGDSVIFDKNQINASDNINNIMNNTDRNNSNPNNVSENFQTGASTNMESNRRKINDSSISGGEVGGASVKGTNDSNSKNHYTSINMSQTRSLNSGSVTPQKSKRSLKDMFSKAFNFSQSVSSNKKDVSQSRLAKMLQEASEGNSKQSYSKRNSKENINDIMSKIDNDKNNTSEISIKNAKLNNSSFIDLNEDQENFNSKVDLKETVKSEMKKFVFNVISDNTNDEYEFTTFFYKSENSESNENNTSQVFDQFNGNSNNESTRNGNNQINIDSSLDNTSRKNSGYDNNSSVNNFNRHNEIKDLVKNSLIKEKNEDNPFKANNPPRDQILFINSNQNNKDNLNPNSNHKKYFVFNLHVYYCEKIFIK